MAYIDPPKKEKDPERQQWLLGLGIIGTILATGLIIWLVLFLPVIPGVGSKTTVTAQLTFEPTVAIPTSMPVIIQPTVTVLSFATQTREPAPAVLPGHDSRILRLNLGPGDISSIDPAKAFDTQSIQIVEETTVGLTRLSETTSLVEPGMAATWEKSFDGLVYTFHLRNDVPWVKWDPNTNSVVTVKNCDNQDRLVMAGDFMFGIRHTLNPATNSMAAGLLVNSIDGARDYNTGVAWDPNSVKIRAIDDWTLEITFLKAGNYNDMIAGMSMAHAQPAWLEKGDKCTDPIGDLWVNNIYYVSYGPFALKEWLHNQSMTLVKNPFWPGDTFVPQSSVEEVQIGLSDEGSAYEQYISGDLEFTALPFDKLEQVKNDSQLSSQLSEEPWLLTGYLGMNSQGLFVGDPRLRRALSLSIDRQQLVDGVTGPGTQPANWFSPPGLAGAPTVDQYPNLGVNYAPDEARRLFAEYLKETNLSPGDVTITLTCTNSLSSQKISSELQKMWQASLGIRIRIALVDRKSLDQAVNSQNSPQIWCDTWKFQYPDANNALRDTFAWGGSMNSWGNGLNWFDPVFEELLTNAAHTSEFDRRIGLYVKAEQQMVFQDSVVIPLFWYKNFTLSQPYLIRTASQIGGIQHWEKWVIH